MDLSKLSPERANEGAWLTLRHPGSGEELDAKIKLRGRDSEVYRRKVREAQNRRVKEAAKNGGTVPVEEIEEDGTEALAACVVEWQDIEENGQSVPFSEENARRLIATYPWIREQVDRFVSNRAHFFGD